ncbi:hypothetical protein OS493_031979 [Desmophyllum pertusum]|uniref:Secreted protein n=1 Tax=Desmophyllum pertusum TaxID=174260 RepID=A0A9W9Z7W3_9CNID|nr:hypothetical protein OS493_031979 [Desmophyllum pertusum]
MSPQTMLCVFILVVCGPIPLTDAQDTITCQNLEYTGAIKEVIETGSTKLAKATFDAAMAGEGFATTIVSAGIDELPYVGMMLSSLFNHIESATGDRGLQLEDVYNSLKTEIDQLKKHMDQSIVELKLDDIKEAFGASDGGGILSHAHHCQDAYKGDADELAHCLENLRAMLSQQYHFFLPEGETASAYEQTLCLCSACSDNSTRL